MHGVTVNDVVVSMCAGAVRRWLLKHHELGNEPLIAQIPVSVRSPEQQGTFGNRILLMGVELHTEIADPVERLRATHESLAEMKERDEALPASLLQDANNFIPPALFTRAAQLTFAWTSNPRLRPTWNLVVSNVPGPQIPLYCAGALLEAIYPVSVIMDGLGLNITVMSYNGSLDIGIVADRDVMPDLGTMTRWLADELEALVVPRVSRATRAHAGRDRAGAGRAPRHRVRPDAPAASDDRCPRRLTRSRWRVRSATACSFPGALEVDARTSCPSIGSIASRPPGSTGSPGRRRRRHGACRHGHRARGHRDPRVRVPHHHVRLDPAPRSGPRAHGRPAAAPRRLAGRLCAARSEPASRSPGSVARPADPHRRARRRRLALQRLRSVGHRLGSHRRRPRGGAARDGDIVWALVDATAGPTLHAEPLRLAAVNASATVTLSFDDHVVPPTA